MSTILDSINNLQSRGQYTFVKDDLIEASGCSQEAFRMAINRQVKRNRVLRLRGGFFVIIPLEYTATGTIPADWFIDDLMRHLELPYYTGLLSAAGIHGAGHQRPQEFQVVTSQPVRPIIRGRLRLRFFSKLNVEDIPTIQSKTHTSFMTVSTPESTALDLFHYSSKIGGLGHVMTVLLELAEMMESDALRAAITRHACLSDVQRLGWGLEISGFSDMAGVVNNYLAGLHREPFMVPLVPGLPRAGAERHPRWRLLINSQVETDL